MFLLLVNWTVNCKCNTLQLSKATIFANWNFHQGFLFSLVTWQFQIISCLFLQCWTPRPGLLCCGWELFKLRLVQCLLPGVFIYTVQPALRFAVPDQAAMEPVTCVLGCPPCWRICVCCLQQPGQAALKAFFWVFCPEKQRSALGWWELNLLDSFWWSCHRALECYSHILSGVIHRWPFLEVRKLFQGGN